MKVAFGYGSDARVRGENQDAVGVFEVGDVVLGIVCDGVGGHTGGQQAATLAVRSVAQALQDGVTSDLRQTLIEAITLANRTIYESGRKSHRLMGMSTTICAAAIRGDLAIIAHVGDSRAYLVRGDEAIGLTRDHTMVNMFVDNELLSPEDAASHPEAHVLARSLGSERQVDIDVHEAIQIQEGDVLLLVTDGVHGFLTEEDLVSDWSRPGVAARHLLRRVAARGGNDNASVVGFRVGGQGDPGMMPTPLPSLESASDALTPSSSDMVHAPDLIDEPMPPALYPIEPEDEPTHYPDDMTTGLEGTALSPPSPASRSVPRTPAPAPVRHQQMEPAPPANGQRKILIIAGIAAAACVVILGGAFVYKNFMGNGISAPVAPNPAPADAIAALSPPVKPPAVVQEPAPPETPAVQSAPGKDVKIAPPPGVWVSVAFPQVRKNSRTKIRFINPPPSPRPRILIKQHVADSKDCGKVEQVIIDAIESSTEFAPLYEELWHCFQDVHQGALHTQLAGIYEFEKVRTHFEGSPIQPREDQSLPYWFLPATDGIERRMDLYDEHGRTPDLLFDDVVQDALDQPLIATRFSHDLQAEAAYARAFQTIRNPSAGDANHWARRVYTIQKHLNSRVGALIREEHPESYTRIVQLLSASTNGFSETYRRGLDAWLEENRGADAKEYDWRTLAIQENIPEEVAQAVLVSSKQLPPPTPGNPEGEVKEPPKVRQGSTSGTSPIDYIPR
ncbi:MAG: protein phosphatase 2C domain-containing protein [Myxococcota bacterium]